MILNILVCFVVFLIGMRVPQWLKLNQHWGRQLRLLWLYHLAFGVIFYFYILEQGGSDSLKYWDGAKTLNYDQAITYLFESQGTKAMYALNYLPSAVVDLSFFTGTMIYCLLGFFGLASFFRISIDLVPQNVKIRGIYIFPAIFYFPNLHFWSCSVGKDSLLFLSVGLFCFGILKFRTRLIIVIAALIISYLVRPHVTLFLSMAFSLAYLFNTRISKFRRAILFAGLVAVGVFMLPSVMRYTKIEELSIDDYERFSETKVKNLSRAHTGSSIDISSYPLPLKIFTFLFRPTITDVNSAISLVAAMENLILLILTVITFRRSPIKTFMRSPFVIKGLVFFLIIGTIAFSLSLGNLGIMLRMRNMFLPGLLIFICWSFSLHQMRTKAPAIIK